MHAPLEKRGGSVARGACLFLVFSSPCGSSLDLFRTSAESPQHPLAPDLALQVLLIDPALSFAGGGGVSPYPLAHPYDRQAMADLERPDWGRWPGLSALRGDVVIVEPGEVLFVPAFWWAHEEQLEPAGVALALQIGPGRRPRPEGAVPLSLGRALERRVRRSESWG